MRSAAASAPAGGGGNVVACSGAPGAAGGGRVTSSEAAEDGPSGGRGSMAFLRQFQGARQASGDGPWAVIVPHLTADCCGGRCRGRPARLRLTTPPGRGRGTGFAQQ